MPDDVGTDAHEAELYELAGRAQAKAIRAHRRRMKRAARTATGQRQPASGWRTLAVSPTQLRGQHGEGLAAAYLAAHGLVVLERNLHCKAGEIDIIATDHTSLIFVEVRLRDSDHYGGAAASVNRHKQRRVIRAAQYFLPRLASTYFAGNIPRCRFDVISIEGSDIHWIQQAFGHI